MCRRRSRSISGNPFFECLHICSCRAIKSSWVFTTLIRLEMAMMFVFLKRDREWLYKVVMSWIRRTICPSFERIIKFVELKFFMELRIQKKHTLNLNRNDPCSWKFIMFLKRCSTRACTYNWWSSRLSNKSISLLSRECLLSLQFSNNVGKKNIFFDSVMTVDYLEIELKVHDSLNKARSITFNQKIRKVCSAWPYYYSNRLNQI